MKGFFFRGAVIDLTCQKMAVVPLAKSQALSFFGGKGLGSHLLLEHNLPRVDPLSPGNCMIIGTGPLADSRIRGSNRYAVFTKSPLTGFYAESYCEGEAAIAISRTGYDFILFKGASSGPVWIEVSDRKVRFHDARELWGQDTCQTQTAVKARCGIKGCGTLAIGPAGENLVRFAVAKSEGDRSGGHMAMGAVMGAKKIKAVVFHGQTRRAFHDPGALAAMAGKMAWENRVFQRGRRAMEPFGSLCGISSRRDIARLTRLCDRLGLDTVSAGRLAALTIEAYRKGRVEEMLESGDTRAVAGLLRKVARREGIGGLLAEGLSSAAMEMDMADPVFPQAESVMVTDHRATLMDAMILSPLYRTVYSWEVLSSLVSMSCGVRLGKAELKGRAAAIADRVLRFNMREGLAQSWVHSV